MTAGVWMQTELQHWRAADQGQAAAWEEAGAWATLEPAAVAFESTSAWQADSEGQGC